MADPIRVLHVVRKMDIGGVQLMIMNYYRLIDKSKVQFDFVVQDFESGYFDAEINRLGGKIHRISSLQSLSKFYKELGYVLKENHYEIVHVHQNFANVHSLLVAYKNKVTNRISHSHNAFPENNPFRKAMKIVIRLLINKLATEKLASSKKAGSWLYGDGELKKNNVKILKNAIEVNRFKLDKKIRLRKRLELSIDDKLVIGHIGHFNHQKNHDFLIDVFQKVIEMRNDAHLILVGKGENKSEILQKITNMRLNDRVTFLSDRSDINELYQAFDVFVFPSHYEGLGIVLIEAQVSGLHCLISDTITQEVDITNYIKRLSLNDSPEHWANNIIEISKKIQNRKDMSGNVNNAGYNIEPESKKLENLYLSKLERIGGS